MPTSRACGGVPARSRPRSRMRPASGASKPATRRSSVDLPEPEPPSSARNSPGATSRLSPSSASTAPKRFSTRSTRSNGASATPRQRPALKRDHSRERARSTAGGGVLGRNALASASAGG